MKRICTLAAAAVTIIAAGCQKETDGPDSGDDFVYAAVKVSISGEEDGSPDSKSVVDMDSADVLKKVLLFAFDPETGKILTYNGTVSSMEGKPVFTCATSSSFDWVLPVESASSEGKTRSMDIFALANYGYGGLDMSLLSPFDGKTPSSSFTSAVLSTITSLTESDLEGMKITCLSNSQLESLNSTGIPMMAVMKNVTLGKGDGLQVGLKRLFARYSIAFDTSEFSDGVSAVSVTVENANTECPVFTEDFRQTDAGKLAAYETATVSDLATVSLGGIDNSIDFFVLENCWGDIGDGTVDPYRVRDDPQTKGKISKCTYLTFEFQDNEQTLLQSRYLYLSGPGGASGNNFDVKRNCSKSYTISLTGTSRGSYPEILFDNDNSYVNVVKVPDTENPYRGAFVIPFTVSVPDSYKSAYPASDSYHISVEKSATAFNAASDGLFLYLASGNSFSGGSSLKIDDLSMSDIDSDGKGSLLGSFNIQYLNSWLATASYSSSDLFQIKSAFKESGHTRNMHLSSLSLTKPFIMEVATGSSPTPYLYQKVMFSTKAVSFDGTGYSASKIKAAVMSGNSVADTAISSVTDSGGKTTFSVSATAVRTGKSVIKLYDSASGDILLRIDVNVKPPKLAFFDSSGNPITRNEGAEVVLDGSRNIYYLRLTDNSGNILSDLTSSVSGRCSVYSRTVSGSVPLTSFPGSFTLTTSGANTISGGLVKPGTKAVLICTSWGGFDWRGTFRSEQMDLSATLSDIDGNTAADYTQILTITNPFLGLEQPWTRTVDLCERFGDNQGIPAFSGETGISFDWPDYTANDLKMKVDEGSMSGKGTTSSSTARIIRSGNSGEFRIPKDLSNFGRAEIYSSYSNSVSGESVTRTLGYVDVFRTFNIGAKFSVQQTPTDYETGFQTFFDAVTLGLLGLMIQDSKIAGSLGMMYVQPAVNFYRSSASYTKDTDMTPLLESLLDWYSADGAVHPTPSELQAAWDYSVVLERTGGLPSNYWTGKWWTSSYGPRKDTWKIMDGRTFLGSGASALDYAMIYSDGDTGEGRIYNSLVEARKNPHLINSRVITCWNKPLYDFRSLSSSGSGTVTVGGRQLRLSGFRIKGTAGADRKLWCNIVPADYSGTLSQNYTAFRLVWENTSETFCLSEGTTRVGLWEIIDPAWYDISPGLDFSSSNTAMLARLGKGYFNSKYTEFLDMVPVDDDSGNYFYSTGDGTISPVYQGSGVTIK